MKKKEIVKRILFCLLACFLMGNWVPALAEEASEQTEKAEAAERGRQALLETGHADFLHFPAEEESVPDMLDSDFPNMPYLYEGTEVTVVAEQGEMSCFLYRGSNNKHYCGWIKSIRLLEEFPGRTIISGDKKADVQPIEEDPEISWGELGFQKFWHPYSRLSETVHGCIGFTLEYQLIKENTRDLDIYCPREIWVNTGTKWVQVGCFEYPEKGAVKVQVWLEEPMDIIAIGTIAQCPDPDIFLTRQTAYDFCVSAPQYTK